jgi:thiol-disulfide isomerase/thioredoxin
MKTKTIMLVVVLSTVCAAGSLFPLNRRAPGMYLRNTNGSYVKLSDLNKNKNVLLSFWATYCVPCRAEMPALVELERKYSTAKNLQLVFVTIDGEDDRDSAIALLDRMNVRNECLFDIYQLSAKKYIPDLKIPALFLVDRYGFIVFEARGGKEESLRDLEKAIQLLR